MKRKLIIFLIYTGIFFVGYLVTGIIVYYAKPEMKMLPGFVENMLHEDWGVKHPDQQDVSALSYKLLQPKNQDTSKQVVFTDDYSSEKGIFCFRGNAQRNAPTRGLLKRRPKRIKLDWVFHTAADGRSTEWGVWGGGSGWTGQALVINWSKAQRRRMKGLKKSYKADDFRKEVIIGSLCGNIYFLDWKTGRPTRKHLSIDNPIKGTVSLDPRMNGLLYVGQGIPNGGRFGAYVFDLFSGEEVFFRNGFDKTARRQWGAFDSNSLIDPKTGYWFHPAENGQIYKARVEDDQTIHKPVKFNYTVSKHRTVGLEASMGAWNNLGFFGDNAGNVFCLDLMTLRPVWCIHNFDDTDASMVLDCDDHGNPWLYIGCEVDLQGANGKAHMRKINAITGEEVWRVSRNCSGSELSGKVNSGGVLASILPGKQKAKDLVFGIFSRVNGTMEGEFVAIEKRTGKVRYSIPMGSYSWASPIDLYDKAGNCYVFFTDLFGMAYLIDGSTGEIIDQRSTGYVFESSPVAWDNRIVVGTRRKAILSFMIE